MTSLPLENLAKIGQLDAVPPSKALGRRLIESARARLADAALVQASAETRFDCAYAVIRSVADLGLLLRGFRTSTHRPGHHQTAIQCLAHTMALDAGRIRLLDALRKQRNLADYEGDAVTAAALAECIDQARLLLAQGEQAAREAGWIDID